MKRIIIIVMTSLLSAVMVCAQNSGTQDFSRLIINGLKVDDTEYTEADIAAALGEPDSVELDELGVCITYDEHNQDAGISGTPLGQVQKKWKAVIGLRSGLPAEGPISSVEIYSPEYLINGFVRVGDNIEKAMQMGGEWITDEGYVADDGGHTVYWRPEYLKMAELTDCVKFYCSADGTIERVSIWRY